MSKPLTLRNREDKGEIDRAFEAFLPRKCSGVFPSYFDNFPHFSWFSALLRRASLQKIRSAQRPEIAPAAAIMAIV
ncbi:MAG TPA: hypothetical protein VFA58_04440 [Chthoniobacterales bacterium]|nr:hypothetical protein [Chthoniobacterales bacterium]